MSVERWLFVDRLYDVLWFVEAFLLAIGGYMIRQHYIETDVGSLVGWLVGSM